MFLCTCRPGSVPLHMQTTVVWVAATRVVVVVVCFYCCSAVPNCALQFQCEWMWSNVACSSSTNSSRKHEKQEQTTPLHHHLTPLHGGVCSGVSETHNLRDVIVALSADLMVFARGRESSKTRQERSLFGHGGDTGNQVPSCLPVIGVS